MNKFLDELINNHNCVKDTDTPYDRMNSEITYLIDFIPRFFSANGEADGIKKMYVMIDKNPDKEIECSDLYSISKIYNEYITGMNEFIDDVKQLSGNESMLNSFRDKFAKAKENDCRFIDSLYNGGFCKKSVLPLSDASINIEYLIDLIPYMKDMKNKCCELNGSLSNDSPSPKNNLVHECGDLLCDSVRNYCYNAVKNIVDTYCAIHSAIDTEPKKEVKFILY